MRTGSTTLAGPPTLGQTAARNSDRSSKNSAQHMAYSTSYHRHTLRSNGLAEAAVKNLKSIVIHCTEKGENIQHAITAWRNTSRQDGSSPAQLFFGSCQRLGLPLLSCHLEENHLQHTDAKNKEATRSTIKQTLMLKSYLTSDPKKGCGSIITRQRSGTN